MDWLKKKFQQKISSSAPEELIQVDPSELHFPFQPNARLSVMCSVKLVNVTDEYVVLVPRTLVRNVAEYYSRPSGAILPPRSTQEFLVTRQAKESVSQSIECDDKYILFSTAVSESFSNSEYGSDIDKFYDKQQGQIWHRRDLGVVLQQPHTEISSSAQHELIQVDPSELRFPFLPNARLSVICSVKLVNVTDDYVVFIPKKLCGNVASYYTRQDGGILPPRSTQKFLVRREAKKSVAQSTECDELYILYSTTVSESFSNSKYSSDLDKFYDEQGGQIWHRRDLGVVLYPAYQQGSPDGMPHTEELIQVDPSELRFPFLPDERMLVSFSVKLVNIMDNYVVFHPRYETTNVAEYQTYPKGAILPPRSTQEFLVTRQAKKSVAQSIECDDVYIMFSIAVTESFSNSKHGSDLGKFYTNQAGQIWHRRDLGVVLYPPYQQESPDGMPKTEVWFT